MFIICSLFKKIWQNGLSSTRPKLTEFGEVRTVTIDNIPYFVGKDVAEILGYSNTQKSIRDHVDDEDKLTERFVRSGFSALTIAAENLSKLDIQVDAC